MKPGAKKWIRAFRLAALVATVPANAVAGSKAPPRYSLEELSRYYGARSGGAIHGVRLPQRGLENLRYEDRESPFPPRFYPDREIGYDLSQALFSIDVPRFNRWKGTADFAEAKRRVYSGLDFNNRFQLHDRPYRYMDTWGQLFHPPIHRLTSPIEEYFAAFAGDGPPAAAEEGHPFFSPELQSRIDERTGTELSFGNRVEVLTNGEAYTEKLRLVNGARRFLYASVMFYACDETSDRLTEALAAKVREGVDVRMITERIYRKFLSFNCVQRMIERGIKVLVVGDTLRSETSTAAMHQKIWIRDGEEAIVGGQNILDYENEATGFNDMNRDSDILLHEGSPAVADVVESYARMWDRYSRIEPNGRPERDAPVMAERIFEARYQKAEQRNRGARGAEHYAARLGNPETRMDGNCRVGVQGAMARIQPNGPMLSEHLAASRDLVLFSSPDIPFDIQDPANRAHLGTNVAEFHRILESRRGPNDPRVVMITNGEGGGAGELSIWFRYRQIQGRREGRAAVSRIARQFRDYTARAAASHNREQSLRLQARNPNVQAWQYFQYHHAKMYLFDRLAGYVGSWNLDRNSGDLNHEAGVMCLDRSLARQLEYDLARDISNSVPVVSRNGH